MVVHIQSSMSFSDYPSKPNGDLVKCSNCQRGFAQERIDKHIQICKNTKERQIYDIAQARVQGTEAGELYKAGRLSYLAFSTVLFSYHFYTFSYIATFGNVLFFITLHRKTTIR